MCGQWEYFFGNMDAGRQCFCSAWLWDLSEVTGENGILHNSYAPQEALLLTDALIFIKGRVF